MSALKPPVLGKTPSIQWDDSPKSIRREHTARHDRQATGRIYQYTGVSSPDNEEEGRYGTPYLYTRPTYAGSGEAEYRARQRWKSSKEEEKACMAMISRVLSTGELSAKAIDPKVYAKLKKLRKKRQHHAELLRTTIEPREMIQQKTTNTMYPGWAEHHTQSHCFRDRNEELELGSPRMHLSNKLIPRAHFKGGGKLKEHETQQKKFYHKVIDSNGVKKSSLSLSEPFQDPPLFDATTPRRHQESKSWISHNFNTSLPSSFTTFDKHATLPAKSIKTNPKKGWRSTTVNKERGPYTEPNMVQMRLEPCREVTNEASRPRFRTIFPQAGNLATKEEADVKTQHLLSSVRLQARMKLAKLSQ